MTIPIKLSEKDTELLDRVTSITFSKYYENDETTTDDLKNLIEDLLGTYEHLQEQIEDIEQDREDNYKRIEIEEQIG